MTSSRDKLPCLEERLVVSSAVLSVLPSGQRVALSVFIVRTYIHALRGCYHPSMATQVTTSHFSTYSSTIKIDGKEPTSETCVTRNSERQATSSEITINNEPIPSFEDVRTKLLPLIKQDSWVKTTRELLQRVDSGAQSIFFKPINQTCRVNFGFVVAIVNAPDEYHYVLNSYLGEWHISAATLIQISQANLRKRLIEEGEKIWRQSETGIQFIQGLGPLTASVILLPDVIGKLNIEGGDAVVVIPTSDLCMVGGSQNVKQLCVMGEISLKFTKQVNFLSTQPLRVVQTEWKLYEANRANDEHPFPKSPDEVKMLKRALKMQGQI